MRESINNIFDRFLNDARGSTAVIMSLSLIPVAGAMGLSVDLARAHMTKTSLQAAVDTAALAGAISYRTNKSTAAAEVAASNAFAASRTGVAATVITNVLDSATGKMTVVAESIQSNLFIFLLNPSKSTTIISARSEVTGGSPSSGGLGINLEVALMLDVTVSMAQSSGTPNLTKLAAMQQAASSLIDTVVQTNQTPYKSRVALAPFSSAVNVGTLFRAFTGTNPTGAWTSVVERTGAYAFSEDAPATGALFPSFRSRRSSALGSAGNYTRNLNANVPANAFVKPLSSDKTALKSAINAYTTSGSTAGHLGTAFSWYTLSPRWASIWGMNGAPAAYDRTKTLKVAVLMSDFEYNTHYQSANGDSSSQAAQLCSNMKAAGIEIYTIGFQVNPNDAKAISLFEDCATSAEHRIPAADGAQMIAAFQTIATTVVEKASGSNKLYVSK